MQESEKSMESRLRLISNELRERTSRLSPQTTTQIAEEILNFHSFRPNLTKKITAYGAKDTGTTGYIKANGFAVLLPIDADDDEADEGEIAYFSHESEARNVMVEHWGKMTEDLEKYILQPAVLQIPFSEGTTIPQMKTTLDQLLELPQGAQDSDTLFPKTYPNEQMFLDDLLRHQASQFQMLSNVLLGSDLLGKNNEGERTIIPKQEWKDWKSDSSQKYPSLPNVKGVKVASDPQIQRILAIEAYLFHRVSEPVLVALAHAHTILGPAMRSPGQRPSLMSGDSFLGANEGDDMLSLIKTMATDGFDLHPVFLKTGQCVGSVVLQDVTTFLVTNGGDSLPEKLHPSELKKIGLLGPAPPILDALEPTHRVAEILTNGVGAILVYFDPTMWGDHSNSEFLRETLEPGYHIVTQHDLVTRTLMTSSQGWQ